MMTPFPPKTPMQMRREAEHGPPRPTAPLTPHQKRGITVTEELRENYGDSALNSRAAQE